MERYKWISFLSINQAILVFRMVSIAFSVVSIISYIYLIKINQQISNWQESESGISIQNIEK